MLLSQLVFQMGDLLFHLSLPSALLTVKSGGTVLKKLFLLTIK